MATYDASLAIAYKAEMKIPMPAFICSELVLWWTTDVWFECEKIRDVYVLEFLPLLLTHVEQLPYSRLSEQEGRGSRKEACLNQFPLGITVIL